MTKDAFSPVFTPIQPCSKTFTEPFLLATSPNLDLEGGSPVHVDAIQFGMEVALFLGPDATEYSSGPTVEMNSRPPGRTGTPSCSPGFRGSVLCQHEGLWSVEDKLVFVQV